jgi:hypothetical protein
MVAPNWTIRGQYLVLALTDSTAFATNLNPTASNNCFDTTRVRQCRMGFLVSEQIARVGLNYKFGYAAAPAVYK